MCINDLDPKGRRMLMNFPDDAKLGCHHNYSEYDILVLMTNIYKFSYCYIQTPAEIYNLERLNYV